MYVLRFLLGVLLVVTVSVNTTYAKEGTVETMNKTGPTQAGSTEVAPTDDDGAEIVTSGNVGKKQKTPPENDAGASDAKQPPPIVSGPSPHALDIDTVLMMSLASFAMGTVGYLVADQTINQPDMNSVSTSLLAGLFVMSSPVVGVVLVGHSKGYKPSGYGHYWMSVVGFAIGGAVGSAKGGWRSYLVGSLTGATALGIVGYHTSLPAPGDVALHSGGSVLAWSRDDGISFGLPIPMYRSFEEHDYWSIHLLNGCF